MEITTNNVPRDLLDYDSLTEKEKKNFDYVKGDEFWQDRFFRYKGEVYDAHDCEVASTVNNPLKDWSGYYSWTYFSGVVFKWVYPEMEQVIVGRYFVG